jgi:cytochrome P450
MTEERERIPHRATPFPGPRGLAHARVMNLAGGDVRAALDACRAEHGDAFVFGFGPIRFHWLLDRDAFRFVLADAAEHFGNAQAYPFLAPIGGETALIATDDPEHLRRRRSVQPAFHQRLVTAWASAAEKRFARFVAEPPTKPLLNELRPIVLEVVLGILLGEGTAERQPRLAADVAAMMAFANQPLLAQLLKMRLPGTPWARFVAARARADAALRADIRARRAGAHPGGGGVLGVLLAHDGSDAALSEDELRDQAISLVSAGFDTTTAAITWTMALLADPERQARARAEIQAGDGAPEAALHASYLQAVIAEALRLYPPAPAILRRVVRDVDFRGSTIPIGSNVGLSIWHLHRDPRLWRDPERVIPERWLERDGAFAASRDPFAYLPFGQGGRYCIGAGLARTLTSVFAATALRHASWSLAAWPRPVGVTLVPDDGLPLRWVVPPS